jgi:phage gpG-like protein
MSFSLNIKGIKSVEDALKRKEKAVTTELDLEMNAYVLDIRNEAIKKAPKGITKRQISTDYGKLGQSFFIDVSKKLNKSVGNSKEYAAYVEFGTGTLVDVPKGLEGYAMKFKGKGIKKVNLPARPFLFNSQRELLPKFLKRIKNLISG